MNNCALCTGGFAFGVPIVQGDLEMHVMNQLIPPREIRRALKISSALCFCLAAMALGGCQTTTTGGSVGAERKQLMLVSSQEPMPEYCSGFAQSRPASNRRPGSSVPTRRPGNGKSM